MHHDVFDYDDGVVNHEPDGSGEATERHEIKALSDEPKDEHGDRHGDGNYHAGNQRGTPVAQEEIKDDAGEEQADEDCVAYAGNAFAHDLGLVVEGLEDYAAREARAQLLNGCRDVVGYLYGVAGRLTRDVEQHGRVTVCRNIGVDRQGRLDYFGEIADAHRCSAGGGLNCEFTQALHIVSLRPYERQHKLMVLWIEARGVDGIGGANGIGKVEHRDTGGLEPGKVGLDVIFGHLAALNGHRRHAVNAIERRLERIGGQFPEVALGDAVVGRGKTVAEDRKGREGETVGGDLRRGRQFLLDAAECGVD